mgnify:CR=1 FL=1
MNIQSDYKHLIKAANLSASQKRLLLKFGCLLLIASIVGLLFPQIGKFLIEEPFYLFIGIIAVFASGLVLFFSTRPE